MFVVSIGIIFIFVLFSLFSENKYKYIITLYLSVMTTTLVAAIVYFSKTSSYNFLTTFDYQLYNAFFWARLHISDIARIYNICFAAMLLISMQLACTVINCRIFYRILLVIPIIFFVLTLDPNANRFMFIHNYTTFKTMLQNIDCLILYIYLTLPIIAVLHTCKMTKIFSKRRNFIILLMLVAIIDLCFLYLFVWGTFRSIMFYNLSIAMLPTTGDTPKPPVSELIVVSLMIFTLLLVTLLQPFKYYDAKRKNVSYRNSRALNQNLGMLFHAYKNSFWSISQQLILASNKFDNDTPLEAKKYIDKALAVSTNHFDRLKNTLFVLTNKRIALVPIDICRCIREACSTIALPNNSKLILSSEVSNGKIKLIGNQYHLTETITNILTNASAAIKQKETPQGQIEINILTENDVCLVSITDNGCGIPLKQQKKIFRLFYTTKSSATNSGIGLNYVKKVVLFHHGDIRIKSVPDVGTKVEMVFPLSAYTNKNRIKARTSTL